MDGVIDLLGGQTPAAHRHVVPVKDLANGPPLDTESVAQLVHRLPTPIPGNEIPNVIGPQSARPAGPGLRNGRPNGVAGVGQLPSQLLQRIYLRFRVRVSSPNVHVSCPVCPTMADSITTLRTHGQEPYRRGTR
ncbi:hypothetical protein ACFYY5_26290 [Nocardia elegans]|uniref:Uncharacterized protein n=1 Tax=Nocardia elegans TaxID=300029 RepID=A0ABW6TNX5_9NOCA